LLVATLFVFYWGANETNALAKAFISISGTGDLLIFSALLLINAGAKFRILDLPTRSKRDLEAGDLNPDLPTWSAFFLLVAYAVIRVALDMKDVQNPALFKFLYGIGTLLILSIVFLWIDNLVRRMHTKQLTHRLEAGLIESQYNF
jgi:undecaprenyl pyrophosphate phosphatase UppP